MFAEDANGRWCAEQIALILPRQNGKNAVLEAFELYAFYVLDEQRIIHTAHLAKTAADHMQRMVALVRSNPELDEITHPYFSNGKEALQRLDTGARLEFITRGRKTARGGSPQRVVFDEALFLTDDQLQAILPALSAQSMNAAGAPQFIYTSSAPLPESAVLHRVRARGMAADGGGKLFFAEWSCVEGTDPADRDAWYASNPGMGIRISEAWVAENELTTLSPEAFAVERLGVVPAHDVGSAVLPTVRWDACRDAGSQVAGGVALALSVSPGSGSAAVGVAGVRVDGLWHVEVTDHRPGTGWVVEVAKRASAVLGVPVHVDPKSPTAGLLPALVAAGVDVVEVSTVEYVAACAAFQDAVLNGRVCHIGQPPLDAAVAGADVRTVGESWAWSQRASTVDISPLNAVTLALSAARSVSVFAGGFHDLDDFVGEE